MTLRNSHRRIGNASCNAVIGSVIGTWVAVARESIWEAIEETAHEIQKDVKSGPNKAPMITGFLRMSYHTLLFKKELRAEVINDTGMAYYAIYVEFGAQGRKPKPHLRPAAIGQAKLFVARINARLKNISVRIGK
jgi:hypothetical protein